MKRISFGLACVLTLSSCASFERSSSSGYADRGSDLGNGRDRRESENDARSNYSDDDEDAPLLRARLKLAEKMLEGRREREQYFKNKPYMKNDRDRLAFLRLESFEQRTHWLATHGVQGTATPNNPEIQALIEVNDITTGMTKQAVRDSWGEPEGIEVAGNPMYGNERWQYSEQISSTEGYQTERRMVFFESGKVIGWSKK